DQHGQENGIEANLRDRRRQVEPAHVEKATAGYDVALARPRQALENGEVPEKQLQQHGQIADYLHVEGGEPRDQPVGGKARNADRETEDGGKDDAQPSDQQRVDEPDQEGPAVGHGVVEGDERLRDIEAGGAINEAEARGDVLSPEVGGGVGDED